MHTVLPHFLFSFHRRRCCQISSFSPTYASCVRLYVKQLNSYSVTDTVTVGGGIAELLRYISDKTLSLGFYFDLSIYFYFILC